MRILFFYLIVCVFTVSCGGGGGGGGAAPGPIPSAPSPSPFPGAQFSLAFDADNAATVLSFALLMPDTAAVIAEKHVVALLRNFQSGPEDQPAATEQFCDEAESVTLAYIDNDSNAQITSGDAIDVLIDNCVFLFNRDGASGGSRATFDRIDVPNSGEIAIEGSLVLNNFPLVLDAVRDEIAFFNGEYQFSFTLDEDGQSLRVFNENSNDTFFTNDGSDQIRMVEFDATKSWVAVSSRGLLSARVELQDSILGGSYGCETLEPLSGTRPTNFTGYLLDCRDRNQTRLLVEAIAQGAYTSLDGTELGLFDIDSVVGESVLTTPSLNQSQFQFSLNYEQLNLDAVDLGIDETRGQFLVATTANSPLYPNALLAINADSLSVDRVLEFDDALTGIWKREGSDFLYSSQANSSEIIVVSLGNFEETQRIALDQTGLIPEDSSLPGVTASPYLMHLSVPLTGPENLVARVGRILSDRPPIPEYMFTAAYENGLELSATLPRTPDPGELHFVSDQQLLNVESAEESVTVLGANGLVSRPRDLATDAISGPDLRVQERYISTQDGALTGSLDGGGYINTDDRINSKVYSVIDGQLVVHDAVRRTLIAHYPIPRAERLREDIRSLLSVSNRVVLARSGSLILLSANVLEDNLVDECEFGQTRTVSDSGLQSSFATCAFTDLVYDGNRNLAYAGIDWRQGRAGKRVVAIDPTTAELVREFPLSINPRHLAVSSDGNLLYVTTAEQRILTIDLDTGETLSQATTPILPAPFTAGTTEYKNQIVYIFPSLSSSSELLVSLAGQVGGGDRRDRLMRLRAGEFILNNRLEISETPAIFYSQDGDLYGLSELPSSTVRLYEIADDGNSFTVLSSVDASPDGTEFIHSDLITVKDAGTNYALLRQNLVNLDDGSISAFGSDTPATLMRRAHNPFSQSVLQLENPGQEPCAIRSYDLAANLKGEYEIPVERCDSRMYEDKLVSVGIDRFALLEVHARNYYNGFNNVELAELQFYPLSLIE